MSINDSSHFSKIPNVKIQRSRFKRQSTHKTTRNVGDIVPIYIDEILPGDTVSMSMSSISRMTTPIYPVMDNAYEDVHWFFVPTRLVWDHWREFNGENTSAPWTQQVEYTIPKFKGSWYKGSVADYFGIPIGQGSVLCSALPFRAYALIYNEWYRNQNLTTPVNIPKGDNTEVIGVDPGDPYDYVINGYRGFRCFKANKYHDYFTSALPQPQKGPDVSLPLGYDAPVYSIPDSHNVYGPDTGYPLKWQRTDYNTFSPSSDYIHTLKPSVDGTTATSIVGSSTPPNVLSYGLTPVNLIANLNNSTGATINALRMAFQLQRLYERDARGGTRYTEIIRSHFGVVSPDSRLQRPEYLGGGRVPINVDQVLQTSSTDATSPQGNTAAYSLTGRTGHMFTQSFTEHGYLMGLSVIRTDNTYQQGLERMWSRNTRFDFYLPALAHIGEQAILNKEIYYNFESNDNDNAFGYQEAWADYRYKPSRVSGAFRSNYAQPLDSWHYADYYQSQPYLSTNWIEQGKAEVDRTLTVPSTLEDQFISDYCFNAVMTRPMPMYSVPGLIDHF